MKKNSVKKFFVKNKDKNCAFEFDNKMTKNLNLTKTIKRDTNKDREEIQKNIFFQIRSNKKGRHQISGIILSIFGDIWLYYFGPNL